VPVGRSRPSRLRLGRFDPASWSGAIILMVALVAVVWVVQIVNAHESYGLDRFGLQPRRAGGLWGVLTMPFLHASWDHLLSNTLPLVLIGWVVMVEGLRTWSIVTSAVVVLGGLLTWLIGPGDTVIVGASALVFGWLGYLIARAVVSRKVRWMISAAMVLVFFGTLLYGLVPVSHSHESWQAHLCGFLTGAAVGSTLHRRGGGRRRSRRGAVS
jgi:membrane associated rhomboid family serine protease